MDCFRLRLRNDVYGISTSGFVPVRRVQYFNPAASLLITHVSYADVNKRTALKAGGLAYE